MQQRQRQGSRVFPQYYLGLLTQLQAILNNVQFSIIYTMGSTMIDTAPIETAEESLSYPRLLDSSISSLSSRRPSNPLISRAYKQASNLFLTRRLQEALSALESAITAPESSDQVPDENETPERAPIASASRSSRIKVWSLYLTLLNAIIETGPEDGKAAFGNRDWNNIVAKTRDGSIWEEVVQTGYGGIEGNVDAEVIINLLEYLLYHRGAQLLIFNCLQSNASTLPVFLSDHQPAAPRVLSFRIK